MISLLRTGFFNPVLYFLKRYRRASVHRSEVDIIFVRGIEVLFSVVFRDSVSGEGKISERSAFTFPIKEEYIIPGSRSIGKAERFIAGPFFVIFVCISVSRKDEKSLFLTVSFIRSFHLRHIFAIHEHLYLRMSVCEQP